MPSASEEWLAGRDGTAGLGETPGWTGLARSVSMEGGVHDRIDHVFRDRISLRGPQRARRRAPRPWSRGAADHSAAQKRGPLVDGGNPGPQGSAARRIRYVDATSRNERRAAQDQERHAA